MNNRSGAHGSLLCKCPFAEIREVKFALTRVGFLLACFPSGWRVAKCVHNAYLKSFCHGHPKFNFRRELSFARYWCENETPATERPAS